jgi:hypothetical protein
LQAAQTQYDNYRRPAPTADVSVSTEGVRPKQKSSDEHIRRTLVKRLSHAALACRRTADMCVTGCETVDATIALQMGRLD